MSLCYHYLLNTAQHQTQQQKCSRASDTRRDFLLRNALFDSQRSTDSSMMVACFVAYPYTYFTTLLDDTLKGLAVAQ